MGKISDELIKRQDAHMSDEEYKEELLEMRKMDAQQIQQDHYLQDQGLI